MQKYISFLRLTEKGQALPPEETAKTYPEMLGVIESFGGRTLETWTAGGDYDFVAISEFPSDEAAYRARVKLSQFGVLRVVGGPTFPIETFLSAVAEKREPAVV